MTAGTKPAAAYPLARWTARASILAMFATAVWFVAGLLDSVAIGLIVVAALLLPIATSLAQPRTVADRRTRR